MTRPQDVVRTGYDAIGERYHEWSHAGPTRLRMVELVLGALPPSAVVVDLGCGPGDPATRLLSEAGHHVLGVDLSRGQLAIARRLAPRATLVQADVTSLALAPGSVDAVVSFYATGHLPASAHASLYAAIGRWLRPGGLLLTSAPLGSGDEADPDWLGVPMFFGGIGVEATVGAVEDGGLVVDSAEVVVEDEGGAERFLWVVAHRRA
jgi:SAM-dependent methyltransferase